MSRVANVTGAFLATAVASSAPPVDGVERETVVGAKDKLGFATTALALPVAGTKVPIPLAFVSTGATK